ncbi:hypothetical protein [Streptomyces sp. NPDC094472]|uniref:hypothetical protein n=1 Tax=unclassified Streptomyces TaxID=2593676 RepID=UPI0033312E2A
MVSNADWGLASGYVVVEPGARGRDLVTPDGRYYGVVPAAIVDLKAAARYLHHNKGRVPGNTDRIVSSGTSAGGALSALLGTSGDSPLYDAPLRELGAADASDAIFAGGGWCPIADLEHADMAYEWMLGGSALSTGEVVDQTVSKQVSAAFLDYQASLRLRGEAGLRPHHRADLRRLPAEDLPPAGGHAVPHGTAGRRSRRLPRHERVDHLVRAIGCATPTNWRGSGAR